MSILKRHADVIVFASIAVVVRVAFWAYTGRLWEDALTSITNARHALQGLGLTHHSGEPAAHSFTSALSVLIPLAGEFVARDGGIVALRLASLAAAIVTIVAAEALARHLGIARWARLLILGYLAIDANHIFYGMTGMETQVAVAALLTSAWAFTIRHPATGITLGVALLARPDFLIWAAIVFGLLLWRERAQVPRVAAGTAVVVTPWIAFTVLAYGSPIPQTIIAKAAAFTSFPIDTTLAGWITWVPEQIMSRASPIGRTFMPFFEDTLAFGAPVPIVLLVMVSTWMVLLAGLGAWDRRREPAWAAMTLFVLVDLGYRFVFLPHEYHDWYVPPFTAMTIFLIAAGLQWLSRTRLLRGEFRGPILAGAIVACFAIPLPWVFAEERAIQEEINEGVRLPLTLALEALVPPGDAVIAEAPGYIGYFSDVIVMDYPGLTSRTTLAAVQRLPRERRSLESLIDSLRPKWIVMRPIELVYFVAGYPETAAEYQEVQRIGSPIEEIARFGYRKVTVDGEFIIMRRRS